MRFFKTCTIVLVLFLIFLAACQPVGAPSSTTPSQDQEIAPAAQSAPTVSAATTEEQQAQWRVADQMQLDHGGHFAAFMSPEFGVSGSQGYRDPHFYHTSDGGRSWVASAEFPGSTASIDIVDARTVWQCGWNGIDLSQDGGQTWQTLTNPIGEGCRHVSFVDESAGWAASISKLAATRDGARTWKEIAIPEEIRKIAAISLRTPQEGYLLDLDGTLYWTDDGGQSWEARTIELEDSDLALTDLREYPSAALRFLDSEHGMVVLNLAGGGKSELLCLHTADGGSSWERERLPSELGILYLSRDGNYLTVNRLGGAGAVTLLEYGSAAEGEGT